MVVRFLKTIYGLELRSALEYRFNFIMQTVGMTLNDIFFIIFWFMFFHVFPSVNGWDFRQVAMLTSICAAGWGIAMSLASNQCHIVRMIEQGKLDYYLSLPKNVLMHCLIRFSYGGFGDVIFGVLMCFILLPVWQWHLALFMMILAAVIITAWNVLSQSLVLFFGPFEKAASLMRELLLIFGTYPWSTYTASMKLVLLLVIPAGFIGGVPVEILSGSGMKWLGLTVLAAVSFSLLAAVLFYIGLRRYESGNMMGMRG
jgi:ABC-2 type transport system permease protein